MIDDIDGGDAVRKATFSLDDTDYEIDLNGSNLRALATALDPFRQESPHRWETSYAHQRCQGYGCFRQESC